MVGTTGRRKDMMRERGREARNVVVLEGWESGFGFPSKDASAAFRIGWP